MTHARGLTVIACAAALAFAGAAASQGAAAAAGCAASDRHAPTSARAGGHQALVPGHPSAVLLCRYRGLNPASSAFRLEGTHLVAGGATVARLARDLDSLRPTRGALACPLASGTAIVAWFRYANGPADPVAVSLDGCMTVTNGHVRRTAGVQATGRAVVAALEKLVPAATP